VGGRRGEVVKTMYTRVSKCKNNKNKIKKKKKKKPSENFRAKQNVNIYICYIAYGNLTPDFINMCN
jgi:hypothetical protein